MALTIKRLRWFIATAALLLIVVVTAYLGLGRYRALKAYFSVLRKAGVTISHDTNGFTYSQTEKGRTVFTLHAKKATQLGEGQWSLHGVNVLLYSRDGLHNNVINGDEFTYNEKEGVVRAIGEVHMDLQAPDSLTSAGRSSVRPLAGAPPNAAHEPANVIHVRTSGVEYLRKLGVATTDQQVEFFYGGIQGTAIGAEFNTDQSTLRLLSHVVANGVLRKQTFVLHATSALIDRTANVATLQQTAVTSGDRAASADVTVLDLRKDGSIASAKATGHVVLTSASERIAAAELDGTFTAQTVPKTARLSGGVQLTGSDVLRPTSGSAAAADMTFDARGALTGITATGSPQLMISDKRMLASGLQREMHGDRIVASFTSTAKGSQMRELHATGSAEARGESLATNAHSAPLQHATPQLKLTTLAADDLDLTLVPGPKGNSEPQKLAALGHTLLHQSAPTGEVLTSAGDRLDASFAHTDIHGSSQLELVSAVQTGHIVVHRTAPRTAAHRTPNSNSTVQQQEFGTATASAANFDNATGKLTLTGDAHLTQDNATLTATTVVLEQGTQDADALGNVQTTLANVSAQSPANTPATYTHILSASAHFVHQSQQAEFHGTDAQPARMWQDASQVQAASILLDDVHHTLAARPASPEALIHATFAGKPSDKPGSRSSSVRVAAAKLDYSDLQREAIFTGPQGVVLQADAGTIHAQRATAYLVPAKAKPAADISPTPFNGSLDRVVISNDVQLEQPGRHGTGDQLVYTAATGESVLTGSPGHPPHIVDAQRGNITGSSLLFGDSGSTIVVSGEAQASNPTRVHTETHIQPGKEERQ